MIGILAILAAAVRFLVLGDIHMDKFDFHDMDYVYTRPSDWRQITQEYPFYTAVYYPKLFDAVRTQTDSGCTAVLQLGDLMEGVAGNYTLSRDMASWAVDNIDKAAGDATVLLVKGNHDVSASPGQPEAWKDIVLPYIMSETGQTLENGMYVYKLSPDVDIFCSEQFFSPDENLPERELLDFLKRELPRSTARYRFLAIHQPVIPVTEKCWHVFSGIRRKTEDAGARDELLSLLAKYRVTVLCAHLHEYSTVVRATPEGNVVQIMLCSTVNSFCPKAPDSGRKPYPAPDNMDTEWQPHTLDVRRKIIGSETEHIRYYTRCSAPGYAIIETGEHGVVFNFYSGYSLSPAESFRIDDLYGL